MAGIRKIKLYNIDIANLQAIKTVIPDAEVVVMIPNSELQQIVDDNYAYLDVLSDFKTIVKSVAVSNEPDLNLPEQLEGLVLVALQKTYNRLQQIGVPANVTVPFPSTIVDFGLTPSSSTLRTEVKEPVQKILQQVSLGLKLQT